MFKYFNKCTSCFEPISYSEAHVISGTEGFFCKACFDLSFKMKLKLEQAYDNEPSVIRAIAQGIDPKTIEEPDIKDDGRHDVSDQMLDVLREVAYLQDHYGMDKYKEPLHHSYNYDWLAMFFEEIADGLKYLQNESERRKLVKLYLQVALESREWEFVEKAYKLLEITGTGK